MIIVEQPNRYPLSDITNVIEAQSLLPFDNERYTFNIIDLQSQLPITNITVDTNSVPNSIITFTGPHQFVKGQTVVIRHNDGIYNGYYEVLNAVNDSTLSIYNITISLILTVPFTFSGAFVSNTTTLRSDIPKMNLNPYYRNFTDSIMLVDQTLEYQSLETKYIHEILIGREYDYEVNILGKIFDSGNVGFIVSDISNFKIGDDVLINIDERIWEYDDNQFETGNVAFSGSSNHYLRTGIPIWVNGQITHPHYNGRTRVKSVISPTEVETDLTWVSSTPTEGGQIIAQLYPEFNNRKATITGFTTFGLDDVILTNLPWVQSDPNVTGKAIRLGDKLRTINEVTSQQFTVYNGTSKDDLTANAEPYVLKSFIPNIIDVTDNHISTARSDNQYRHTISRDSKEHLLIHFEPNISSASLVVESYDGSNTQIGYTEFPITIPLNDMKIPVGLSDLTTNPNYSGDDISSIITDIDHYTIYVNALVNKAAYFPDDINTPNRSLGTLGTAAIGLPVILYALVSDVGDNCEINFKLNQAEISMKLTGSNITQIDVDTPNESLTDSSMSIDMSDERLIAIRMLTTTYINIMIYSDNTTFTLIDFNLIDPLSFSDLKIMDTNYVGNLHWVGIYQESNYKPLTNFGGFGNWLNYPAVDQTDILLWWSMNEGNIWNPFITSYPTANRIDELANVTLIDTGGIPALGDNLTGTAIQEFSMPITYQLPRYCLGYRNDVELIFLDSKGSYITVPFKALNRQFVDVNKQTYYDNTVGDIITNSKQRKRWELSSDVVSELELPTYVEMMNSTVYYLHEFETGEVTKCTVDDTSLEITNNDYNGVITYELAVIESKDTRRW